MVSIEPALCGSDPPQAGPAFLLGALLEVLAAQTGDGQRLALAVRRAQTRQPSQPCGVWLGVALRHAGCATRHVAHCGSEM